MTAFDWQGLAALVVATGGALGAILGALRLLRGDKFRRSVEESTALLSGYRDMVASLRVDVDNARKELAAERKSWNNERRELYAEMDGFRQSVVAERLAWGKERKELHGQMDELREEVAQLMDRSDANRSRRTDEPGPPDRWVKRPRP